MSPELSGPISDRLRKLFAPNAKAWNPPRGTPAPSKTKPSVGLPLGGTPGRKRK